MVMAQLGITAEDALVLLRAHAYAEDVTLDAIAAQIVDRHLDFKYTDTDPEDT
jgi:AmiR/NasT family two-component response regulator